MEISDALDFLRDKRNGTLVTIKSDGRPQSSNVVYRLVDDTIVVSLTDGRAKTRNLRRDPRASLHVNRDDFWAYVVVEADAEFTPVAADPNDATVDGLVEYYRAMAGEHDDWDDYRRAMVEEGRLLLTLRPTHAYGMANR
ncbi:MAG: PPOX class F420-dependent oxidoreductase [Actinomycetota bacterium]